MKTLKKRLFVVVLMLGTLVNYANNNDMNVELNAKKTKVVFKGTKKGQRLTIKDDNGVILHLEKISKDGDLVKFFNFSKLNDGFYTLELEKDFQIVVKKLQVKNDKVTFDKSAEKIIFKPVVRSKENKLMISKIAFDEKPLEVVLYYKNEMIYSEILKSEAILNRVYKLDENEKGNYTVVIKNDGRNYVNEFKI